MRGFWRLAVLVIWLHVALRLTVRDSIPLLSILYYAFPTVVLAIAALVLGVASLPLRRSRAERVALFGLTVLAAAAWLWSDFRWGAPASVAAAPGTPVRLAFWNVGRGWFGEWDEIAARVATLDADVVALAEATSRDVQRSEFWQSRLPDYLPLPLEDGIVLLVKGNLQVRKSGVLRNRGRFRHVQVTSRGISFDLLLADIVSDPWVSRRPSLDDLLKIVQSTRDRPLVIVGDFNTPPSSVCFDSWRRELQRAWDAAGSGYQATWPQPLPVLALDHLWGNAGIQFTDCSAGWASESDHRPLLATFTVQSLSE